MAHKLIVGTTESGKSTLARSMVEDAAKRGAFVIVYDPTLNPAWATEFVTADEYQFFAWIHEAHENGITSIVAVVDEADTIMSMSHRHNWWLASRGRHFGIEAIFITQRPTMIAPSVRGMPSEHYAFRIPKSDAQLLADDCAAPELAGAAELAQGEFLRARWVDRKKVVDKLKIF